MKKTIKDELARQKAIFKGIRNRKMVMSRNGRECYSIKWHDEIYVLKDHSDSNESLDRESGRLE